jgi:hypothetical protein
MGELALIRDEGPAPEPEIAFDMVKRAAWLLPVTLMFGAIGWGAAGMLSAGYALAIVCANFLLSAFLLAKSARISLGLLMTAALFGFLVRMGLILLAVWVVRDAWWLEPWPLGITLISTHLGLLFWEMNHISASLAFPGLVPAPAKPLAPTLETKESTPS